MVMYFVSLAVLYKWFIRSGLVYKVTGIVIFHQHFSMIYIDSSRVKQNSLLRGPGGGSNRDLFLGIITKERMEAK